MPSALRPQAKPNLALLRGLSSEELEGLSSLFKEIGAATQRAALPDELNLTLAWQKLMEQEITKRQTEANLENTPVLNP